MILLVISGSEERFDTLSKHVKPLGFDLVHYSHVQKALDNFKEINPRALIVSAQDFPRHWKVVVQFVRCERIKEVCPIYLFTGPGFTTEDKTKASFLGVNHHLEENFDDLNEIVNFLEMLSRNVLPDERRRHSRLVVEPWHRFNFLFVSPDKRKIVTGDLLTISIGGITFKPHDRELVKDIAQDTEVPECSLRIGSSIYSLDCKLVRISDTVSIQFISIPEQGKRTLVKYLRDISA